MNKKYIDPEKIKITTQVMKDADGESYVRLSDVIRSIQQAPSEDVVPLKAGKSQGIDYDYILGAYRRTCAQAANDLERYLLRGEQPGIGEVARAIVELRKLDEEFKKSDGFILIRSENNEISKEELIARLRHDL